MRNEGKVIRVNYDGTLGDMPVKVDFICKTWGIIEGLKEALRAKVKQSESKGETGETGLLALCSPHVMPGLCFKT